MQITAVVPLDKRRSKVLCEEGFAFVLYKGELKKYQIEEGMDLSEETYEEILHQVLIKRAKERALYLLKDRDRTEQEIRRKLREGFYPEDSIAQTINFLKEYRFLDDWEYGRRYIRTYGNSRSKKRLQFDLQQKGLDREQIRLLLEESDGDISEDAQIEKFLKKKGYQKGETPPKEREKLMAALVRKGFSYDAVSRMMGGWMESE